MTSGGRKIAHVAKTSGPYTATTSDHVILCDGTSGSFTINLPAVATSDKVTYFIKHISTGANTITVDGNASETIDNATTQALPAGTAITIVCDGTEWHII